MCWYKVLAPPIAFPNTLEFSSHLQVSCSQRRRLASEARTDSGMRVAVLCTSECGSTVLSISSSTKINISLASRPTVSRCLRLSVAFVLHIGSLIGAQWQYLGCLTVLLQEFPSYSPHVSCFYSSVPIPLYEDLPTPSSLISMFRGYVHVYPEK